MENFEINNNELIYCNVDIDIVNIPNNVEKISFGAFKYQDINKIIILEFPK